VYLIAHGVIKGVLAIGLLSHRTWAGAAATWLLGAFVGVEAWRYAHTQSPWLLLFMAIDLATIVLVRHEYRQRRLRQPA
jgi:uncharacterized membrane protein